MKILNGLMVCVSAAVLLGAGGLAVAQDSNAPATPATPATTAAQPRDQATALSEQEKIAAEAAESEGANALVAMAATKSRLRDPAMSPESLPSLFFTAWQHALLQEAKMQFVTRPATDSEVAAGTDTSVSRPAGPREVALGGIVFKGQDSWTVWLNGVRITKDAIPKQVLDIKVARQYIDLKWYDTSTNLVFPIRLRPHERFNLDARIFLPGMGTEASRM